jgi:hypothetical protein
VTIKELPLVWHRVVLGATFVHCGAAVAIGAIAIAADTPAVARIVIAGILVRMVHRRQITVGRHSRTTRITSIQGRRVVEVPPTRSSDGATDAGLFLLLQLWENVAFPARENPSMSGPICCTCTSSTSASK